MSDFVFPKTFIGRNVTYFGSIALNTKKGDGSNATPYELMLAEKERTGWFHYLKMCMVVAKITLISSMMMTGVVKRRLKHGKFDSITALFLSYITILIGLLAFEFGR